jgi:uncharacterized protein (TIGR02270 family)
VLRDIVEEHLGEGAFLWTQWERALVSPRYALAEVAAGPEERLVAHLDGLSLASAEALQRMLGDALGKDVPGTVFAAALALLGAEGTGATGELERLPAVAEKQPEHSAAVARAMGLCRRRELEPELAALLKSPHRSAQVCALEALAFRQVDVTASLRPFVLGEDPAVTAAALRAARTGGSSVRPLVEYALTSPVPAIRDAAIETGLLLGLRGAWARARQAVERGEEGTAFPLAVLAMAGDATDLVLVEKALDLPRLRSSALAAFAVGGTARTAELCLAYLDDPVHGRLAGEAFSAITGIPIEGALERQEQESGEPIPFEEDDLDADLRPGPDGDLPLPRAEEIQRWWESIGRGLPSKVRLLGGKPFAIETLVELLSKGPMRRRRIAALELAIRTRGEYAVETRTWAREQERTLAAVRLAVRSQFLQPFSRLLQA